PSFALNCHFVPVEPRAGSDGNARTAMGWVSPSSRRTTTGSFAYDPSGISIFAPSLPSSFLVVTLTLAFGSATSLVQRHLQSLRHGPGHVPIMRPSHGSVPSTIPSPHVWRSQASPTPSPSVSVWAGFGTSGQLSRWSGTPSPSVSGLAGTMLCGAHVVPGGQSAPVMQTPCVRVHVPNTQVAAEPHWSSDVQLPPISTQAPVEM